MNCLTYLLSIWNIKPIFTILYDGNHCISDLGHDLKNEYVGDVTRYIPIQNCHKKDTIKKIFELDENYSKIIDEYFAQLKNNV